MRAQENYLAQFLRHRNAYTGRRNQDDDDIVAFEVCNEPRYQLPLAPVTAFANRMVAAIRGTGCRKPIFYNIAENPAVHEAILDARLDGLTYQWYPEGLVGGHALRGNFLPYVDQYPDSLPSGPALPAPRPDGVRVRVGRYAAARHVPVHGPQLPGGRVSVGHAVCLRPAGPGLRQYRVSNALPQPGLHARQSPEPADCGRGVPAGEARAGVRALPGRLGVRGFSGQLPAASERAERAGGLLLHQLDRHATPESGRAAARGGHGHVGGGGLRRHRRLLPRPAGARCVAPGGAARRRAPARPVRHDFAAPSRDPNRVERPAPAPRAARPGRRLLGARAERGQQLPRPGTK